MITTEQANKMKALLEDLDECFCNDNSINWFNLDQILDEKDKLLDEIEANKSTYGDRIRQMTDEELAKKLAWHFKCSKCPLTTDCNSHSVKDCKDMFEEWLKKEAKQ